MIEATRDTLEVTRENLEATRAIPEATGETLETTRVIPEATGEILQAPREISKSRDDTRYVRKVFFEQRPHIEREAIVINASDDRRIVLQEPRVLLVGVAFDGDGHRGDGFGRRRAAAEGAAAVDDVRGAEPLGALAQGFDRRREHAVDRHALLVAIGDERAQRLGDDGIAFLAGAEGAHERMPAAFG